MEIVLLMLVLFVYLLLEDRSDRHAYHRRALLLRYYARSNGRPR